MNCRFEMKIFMALIMLTMAGCSNAYSGVYEFRPFNGVTLIIQTKEIKQYPKIESVFLYFELTVRNQSLNEVYLDLGQLKASLNGISSTATHYDSLASVIPEKEKLAAGESHFELYFAFPESVDLRNGIQDFKLINYGLSTH